MDWKGLVQRTLYSRWKPAGLPSDGYSIIMPMPEDMPFLLRLALEGLRHVGTDHCGQVIVVGDGWGSDRGEALRKVAGEFSDSRIEMAFFSRLDRAVVRRMPSPHWLTVIYGINRARHDYAFLHDSDAFFLERDCMERTYAYCRERSMYAIGVTARWDPFFEQIGYQIPGTWQMIFSALWLRTHKPWKVHGRQVATPHGPNIFDTLLYPQYLDYGTGRIGVMPDPPKYVHFNGTIVTYRTWRRAGGKPVVDELFRLLLLSLLEHVIPPADGKRLLPPVDELSHGLTDATCPIRYDTLDCARNYGEFRDQVKELCGSPIFAGERAHVIESLLRPFDEHFAKVTHELGDQLGGPVRKFRRSGLAGSEV